VVWVGGTDRALGESVGAQSHILTAAADMVSNRFSIATHSDAGMLDLLGFDAAAPQLMADFVAGRLGLGRLAVT